MTASRCLTSTVIFVFIVSGAVVADDLLPVLDSAESLEAGHEYTHLILRPDPELMVSPRFIALSPLTQTVTIEAKPLEFEAEVTSFRQFRRHYAFYWGLFMAMLIIDTKWAE